MHLENSLALVSYIKMKNPLFDELNHSNGHRELTLAAMQLDTPLGPMIAIADASGLYLLEFMQRIQLKRNIQHLQQTLKANVTLSDNLILENIKDEINAYFSGEKSTFTTSVHMRGSPFQTKVWRTLQEIPYGQAISYAELARAINKPNAYRAVAKANSTNQLAIIVPCHRVINSNGKLGGYAGGIERKQKLLKLEGYPGSFC